jgi:transmembrane protein DUF3566
MARIRRFGVAQTAKVVGILYALMGIALIPLFLVATLFAPNRSGFSLGFAAMWPVIYGVTGFIFTAIGCALYNVVADLVGGIEIDVDE